MRAVVDHQAGNPRRARAGGKDRTGGEQQVTEQQLVGGLGLGEARNRLLREEDHMHRSLRLDVVDRQAEVVLVHDAGGDFPAMMRSKIVGMIRGAGLHTIPAGESRQQKRVAR